MRDTLEWFQIAKSNPTARDFFSQYACHIEEFTESVEALDQEGNGQGGALVTYLNMAQAELRKMSSSDSDEEVLLAYRGIDRVKMLDSLCDTIVTSINTAKVLGMDILGAFKEVEASNLSKYVYVGVGDISDLEWLDLDKQVKEIEAQGRYKGVYWLRKGVYVVFYDENGKILKSPRTYFEPSLEKFV